jgi:hypothetical protein
VRRDDRGNDTRELDVLSRSEMGRDQSGTRRITFEPSQLRLGAAKPVYHRAHDIVETLGDVPEERDESDP